MKRTVLVLLAGVPTTVVHLRGLSHEQVNRRLGERTDRVLTPRVEAFLEACFAR